MATLLSYALTTLADVKETLGLSSGDHSKDNLITRKINQATEMIEKYCDRRFISTAYSNEEYDSTYINQVILKNRPVISFTSLDTRDTTLNLNDWEAVDSQLYFVDNNAGVIDLNFRAGSGLGGGGWNRIRASYTAGYATIPSDISEAAAMLAAYLVLNPTSGAAIKSKQEGQRRIDYYDTHNRMGANHLFDQLNLTEMLQPYCNYPILADK